MRLVVAFHEFAAFLLRLSKHLVVVFPDFGNLSILLELLVVVVFLLLHIVSGFSLDLFLIPMPDFLGFGRFLCFLLFLLSLLMIL